MVLTHIPTTFDKIPDDATMAAKYFLDIMNDGSLDMQNCTREILKALWMRLAIPESPEVSDSDLGDAIGKWYRTMNRPQTSLITAALNAPDE